jgi:hypothetical protein
MNSNGSSMQKLFIKIKPDNRLFQIARTVSTTSLIILLIIQGCNSNLDKSTDKSHENSIGIDNDTLRVKLDLNRGGTISYISVSGSKRNLVNIYDEGRYIQQSYYAGKSLDRQSEGQNPDWSPWPWNPIQAGDSYGNKAEILEYKKESNTFYVKCIPMQWDMNNKPAEAVLEQWTTLNGNVLKVRNKLTCNRTDTIYGEVVDAEQELPAVYPISALSNLYTYFGDAPFEGNPLEKVKVEYLQDGFWGRYKNDTITENWMAFVDDKNWGMAVFTPSSTNFLAGMAGNPGGEELDASTSYIAPLQTIRLYKNSVFEYDYYIIIGKLEDMREKIYKLKETV